MYFFGYGSFVSSVGLVGVTLTKHISINGGYNLASHLTVNVASDRLGLQLVAKRRARRGRIFLLGNQPLPAK